MVDIRQDEEVIRLINNGLSEGKILEIRNLPRKGVPVNVCVVEIGRHVLTKKRDDAWNDAGNGV